MLDDYQKGNPVYYSMFRLVHWYLNFLHCCICFKFITACSGLFIGILISYTVVSVLSFKFILNPIVSHIYLFHFR